MTDATFRICFFSSRRRHTRCGRDWSSDVCSSDLDPNYDGNIILNKLYQSTSLQNSFSMKIRALIDDQPQIFSLQKILQEFINKRLENIEKKAQFLHQKNKKELINLET